MHNEKLLSLPKILDKRGNLSFIEECNHVPFNIKRVYWIHDVPGGETRGGHAFYKSEEFVVALSGSFDVVIDDGKTTRIIQLNRSYYGLYIPPLTWRHMENFSTNALALILSSTSYASDDYIRDRNDYLESLLCD